MSGPVLVKFPTHPTCEETANYEAIVVPLVLGVVFGSVFSLILAVTLLEAGWLTALVAYVLGGVAGAILVFAAKLNEGFAASSGAGERTIEQRSEEVRQMLD